jgi:WG containing repeat
VRTLTATLAALALTGSAVFACSYSMLVWEPTSDADPAYFSVWSGRKQGWIDRTGRWIHFEPGSAPKDSGRLEPLRQGDRFSYTQDGKIIIPARFLAAGEFFEGRASVVLEGPCIPPGAGFCGAPVVLPPTAKPPSVPLLDVLSGRWRPTAPTCQYAFINELGEVVGPAKFQETRDFHERLAAVRRNEVWGYVNRDLSVVIEPRFRTAEDFSEGLAVVSDSAAFSYIDQTGRVAIPGPFDDASEFHEGLAVVYQNERA